MLLHVEESQLVLVDYQTRLMPAIPDSNVVIANAIRLARMAALLNVPTIVTEQNPSKLGASVPELHQALNPRSVRVLSKMQFGAVEEGLTEWLRPQSAPPKGNARSLPKHLQKSSVQADRHSVVIAGCETHVCLLQTAVQLLEDEFDVWVVTDACGSRTERNRDAAFDRLAGLGVELVTTEMVGFEWVRTAEHPEFKQFQSLIK